jgi:hypothetical protein
MLTCSSCGGLTTSSCGLACLHCEAPLSPPRRSARWRYLLAPAGAVLLAACYGAPGRYKYAYNPGPTAADRDGDGARADVDCDDNDRNRFPGAADLDGDDFDTNCDGVDGWRDPSQPAKVAGERAAQSAPTDATTETIAK